MLITACPNCKTSFFMTEEQMTFGQGKVKCGQCGIFFNARENLKIDASEVEIKAAKEETLAEEYITGPEAFGYQIPEQLSKAANNNQIASFDLEIQPDAGINDVLHERDYLSISRSDKAQKEKSQLEKTKRSIVIDPIGEDNHISIVGNTSKEAFSTGSISIHSILEKNLQSDSIKIPEPENGEFTEEDSTVQEHKEIATEIEEVQAEGAVSPSPKKKKTIADFINEQEETDITFDTENTFGTKTQTLETEKNPTEEQAMGIPLLEASNTDSIYSSWAMRISYAAIFFLILQVIIAFIQLPNSEKKASIRTLSSSAIIKDDQLLVYVDARANNVESTQNTLMHLTLLDRDKNVIVKKTFAPEEFLRYAQNDNGSLSIELPLHMDFPTSFYRHTVSWETPAKQL